VTPRVSLLMCTYNAAWCVERALDSVMAQSRPPDQIVVADDGSTDDTVARIEDRYGDRVRLLRLAHTGLTATRRAAIAVADGDWLALLDADDTWLPEKLERQLAFLARHPGVRWISTDGALVSDEGVIRESWLSDYFTPVREMAGDLLPLLVDRCFPLVSSSLIETRAYHEVGGFDPAVVWSQDYDLWLRLAARYPGAVMADRLVTYFSSPGQLSRRIEERYRDDLGLLRRIERGDLGRRPALQRVASERAAALEFDLAIACLRSARTREARVRLRRAAARGPFRRRLLAMCGATLPSAALSRLMRSGWLKEVVQGARHRAGRRAIDPRTRSAT